MHSIRMISDEIEKLWATGKSDNEIATIISDATGMRLTSDDIVKYYADAEKRAR